MFLHDSNYDLCHGSSMETVKEHEFDPFQLRLSDRLEADPLTIGQLENSSTLNQIIINFTNGMML